jgi:carboxymethylenebutenolidase
MIAGGSERRRRGRKAAGLALGAAACGALVPAGVYIYTTEAGAPAPVPAHAPAAPAGATAAVLGFSVGTTADGVRRDLDRFPSDGRPIWVERYVPAGAGRRPAVVLLHGGGGVVPALCRLGEDLARRGYLALVPHYFDQTGTGTATPPVIDANFVTWMGTVRRAVGYAREMPEVDPDRVGLLGWSLGGSLALEVAATGAPVAAVVDYCCGMEQSILDGAERMPPTLLLHGELDRNYPAWMARKLADDMRRRGFDVESRIYPGQGHGFIGKADEDASRRRDAFLDRHLRPAAAGRDGGAAP